eukprot:CAMPEP_0185027244 /NCGR_PEP_ID=MMETSP1103-20130426/12041_1 /TAXON_ID=36769 /ORGANISM="Paraphysomonas bandaiensis, Strain Caron Lab Isolate" /LENGTH=561 /DNA_ID=CAMNT_0027561139 /DNA_START=104 /DNA_END=1789 /DNA_ORIENTATION=-
MEDGESYPSLDLPPTIDRKLYKLDSYMSDVSSPSISQRYSGFDEAFWHKIVRSADGLENLTSEDAKKLIAVLRDEDHPTTESYIVSKIFNRLKRQEDVLDEGFFRYLSENYNKIVASPSVSGQEFSTGNEKPPYDGCSDHANGSDALTNETTELRRVSSSASEILKGIDKWDFRIFELYEVAAKPIVAVTLHCLGELNLIDALDFHEDRLRSFMHCIHEAYNDLPYHNALHGADVTQTVFYFLSTARALEALQLNQIAAASIIIAAAIHDVGHPGLNGKFLITTNSAIAIEYSDKSPLEMMHLATAFRLWRMDENNFTDKIPVAIYREMRRLIVEMVLLTDNDMHFVLLNRLDRLITVHSSSPEQPSSPSAMECAVEVPTTFYSLSSRTPASHPNTDDRQLLLLQVTLHTADVSNTAKPWSTYNKWLERIMDEFYLQGDMERSLDMPISYAFDRRNPVNQSKFQVGFIKAIVGPLYKTFSKVEGINISECLNHLSSNARVWKEAIAEEESPSVLLKLSRDDSEDPSPNGLTHFDKRARRVSPIIFDGRHSSASPMTFDNPS